MTALLFEFRRPLVHELHEMLIWVFRDSFAELPIFFYDHRYVDAVAVHVAFYGFYRQYKSVFYGLGGHACRFAGRVLQVGEKFERFLDFCFVLPLGETPNAHSVIGGTLRALRRELA